MLNKKVGEKKFNLKVLIMKKYFHKFIFTIFIKNKNIYYFK